MNWSEDYIGKIIHGDCLEVMKDIPDKSIDLVLTDPPYHFDRDNGTGRFRDFYETLTPADMEIAYREIYRILKPTCHLYSFCSKDYIFWFHSLLLRAGFKYLNLLIWDKKHIKMGYHYRNRAEFIFFMSKDKAKKTNRDDIANILVEWVKDSRCGEGLHPSVKPLNVSTTLTEMSTSSSDLILDPFSGSGTTAIACHRLKRRFICIEKEKKYVDLSRKRLEEERAQQKLF